MVIHASRVEYHMYVLYDYLPAYPYSTLDQKPLG